MNLFNRLRVKSCINSVFHPTCNQKFVVNFIFFLGIFIRASHYLKNRSLWQDEAPIALHIMDKSFFQLATPVKGALDQIVPTGFLLIEKTITILFGNSEYSLRLFPLICGLLSLWLFYTIVKKYLTPMGTIIALTLLAFNPLAINYCFECRVYEADIFFTLLLFSLFFKSRENNYNSASIAALSLGAVISIVCSFPAVITTFIIFPIILTDTLQKNNTPAFRKSCLAMIIVLACSAMYYFYFILPVNIQKIALMRGIWFDYTAYRPSVGIADKGKMNLAATVLLPSFFESPLYIYPVLGISVFLIGLVSMFTKNRVLFWLLFMPVVFAFSLNVFEIYPCVDRTGLYLLPPAIMLIAQGYAFLIEKSEKLNKWVTAAVIVLIFLPLYSKIKIPYTRYETRNAVNFLYAHMKPGDKIFVPKRASDVFKYYSRRLGRSPDNDTCKIVCAEKNEIPSKRCGDLPAIGDYRRAWIVVSQYNDSMPSDKEEKQAIINYLQDNTKLFVAYPSGSALYLVEKQRKHVTHAH